MDTVATAASRVYCFGGLRFDSMRRLLFRSSEVVPVPERLALILTLLVQSNGNVVGKETLALSVWPHEAVSDANLAQHVYLLRRLLGEHARDHGYILSVFRRGYRFAVPVTVEHPTLVESFTADAASLGEALHAERFEPFREYCQGSFFLEQRTAPNLKRAIEHFEAALRADPDYVPALIGLARAQTFLATYWHVPPNVAFPFAKKAIERALSIEPASAVAHAVRSGILAFCDWNWGEAQSESDVAVKLNPGSTFVRTNAAWMYVCIGRYREALEQAQLALMMEPSSLPLRLLVARMLLHLREYSRAVAIMSNILEADPAFYLARRYRAQAQLLGGEPERAALDLDLLPQERSEDPSFRLPMLGRAYADSNDVERAEQILTTLRTMAGTDYVVYWNLAIVAAGLGRSEEALSYLESAYRQRETTLVFLKSMPWFESVAGDPRFRALLHGVGPA